MLRPREAVADRVSMPERPDPVASLSVLLLVLTAGGIAAGGILAVYDWTTPAAVKPLFWGVLATFCACLGVQVLAAAIRRPRHGRR